MPGTRARTAPAQNVRARHMRVIALGTCLEERKVMAKTTRWTWQLGRIAGIAIRIHVTLLLLLAWIAIAYIVAGASGGAVVLGLMLVLSVFVVIVVHELAHALVARRFGVRTRDILLLPIGGIASLERMPENPVQELAVALVGPAVNLALAMVLWAMASGVFVRQLMGIHIGLGLVNLIPAVPMDGGRALRSLLAIGVGPTRATD